MNERIRKAVTFFTEETGIMDGMAVCCGRNGRRQWAWDGREIGPDTVYDLASVTKIFNGLCLMKLWERGKLDPFRRISWYCPEFSRLGEVTVEQLMSFQVQLRTPERIDRQRTREEALACLRETQSLGGCGRRAYSDIPAMVLKYVVEKASGMDMMECVRKAVLEPAGMTSTWAAVPEERTFLADLAAVTNRAHGNPTWITEMGWPTGCGNGTVSEREQAGKYARAYMTAAGSGMIHSIYGYDFVDDGFNVLERENNFGIVRRDLTPKPAYRALAKVCRTFGSGTPALESVNLSVGKAWIFRMGGRSAVWATEKARLVVQTDSPTEATNLMDEKLGDGQTRASVTTGPLAPVFFNAKVLSVSEDRSAGYPSAPDDAITF